MLFQPGDLSSIYKGPKIDSVSYMGYAPGELCFGDDCIEAEENSVKIFKNAPQPGQITVIGDHVQKSDEPACGWAPSAKSSTSRRASKSKWSSISRAELLPF